MNAFRKEGGRGLVEPHCGAGGTGESKEQTHEASMSERTDGTGLLTIHPRHVPCAAARVELKSFLIEWGERHKLTAAEELSIITSELAGITGALVTSERRRRRKAGPPDAPTPS